MANNNMQNNEFIHDTGLHEENSLTHLLDAISPDVENEAVLIEHSKYFDDLEFRTILHVGTLLTQAQVCRATPVTAATMQVRFRRRSRVKKYTPPLHKKPKPPMPKKIRPPDELVLQQPLDDVWIAKYYDRQRHSLIDVLEMHRETCMPSMLNHPNSILYVNVKLDMTTKKKTKFLSGIRRTVSLPHTFEDNVPNRVMAFCKTPAEAALAESAGATYFGSEELIQRVLSREIQSEDYEHVVCTMDALQTIGVIRKQLGYSFPNKAKGALGTDIGLLVSKFFLGKTYESTKSSDAVGHVVVPFGRLNMDTEHLIDNFHGLVDDINSYKAQAAKFISEITISCPPSPEEFLLLDRHTKSVENRDEQHHQNIAVSGS